MRHVYYFAAWTDNEFGCGHRHKTIVSAVHCIAAAGGYVIASEKGKLRQLTDIEESEFQRAMYGTGKERLLDAELSLAILKSLGLESNN
jgi:hypothetical protein